MTSQSLLEQPKTPSWWPQQAILAKIFHWANLISLLLMMTSGMQIYNANPVFGGRGGLQFPFVFLLGGWLAGGRHWHFAAMWLFSLNLLWYGLYILATQRWRHRFVNGQDLKALQASKNPKRLTYAWHRLAYTTIVLILVLAIFSGLGMYKPAQLHWIVDLVGGWQPLRIVHFSTVPIAIGFAIVHVRSVLKIGGSRLVDSMFW